MVYYYGDILDTLWLLSLLIANSEMQLHVPYI